VRVEGIQPAYAVPTLAEQTGLGEHLEVMTDGLLRRVEMRGDLTGGELAAPHQSKDLTAMRVGERPKYGVRGVTFIGWTGGHAGSSCTHDDKDLS
jgi:hypothetical protein